MDDCRRGEDPRVVFMGERAFGGGRCVLALRINLADVARSGMEPASIGQSLHWQLCT